MAQRLETITLQANNGNPAVEIIFGHAHVGNYRCFLWDQNGKSPIQLAHGNNVDDVWDTFVIDNNPDYLADRVFSYELTIQAAESKPGQIYSVTITVRQQGSVCQGGVIHDTGSLDDVKSIIGFRKFRTE